MFTFANFSNLGITILLYVFYFNRTNYTVITHFVCKKNIFQSQTFYFDIYKQHKKKQID